MMFTHLGNHVADSLKLRAVKINLHHDLVIVLVGDASILEEEVSFGHIIDCKTSLFLCRRIPDAKGNAVIMKSSVVAVEIKESIQRFALLI